MSIKQYVVFVFILWNVFVFITYGVDKIKAIKGRWRIPEKTLLWESILFGGLGAFLGGNFFHHKTLKWYFRACWYLGIIINVVFAYWYFMMWK